VSSVIVTIGLIFVVPGSRLGRVSMATAYVGLALLAWTLFTGPLNVLRRRANPVSTDFRRDVGIWAGILSVVHVVVGLQVHMGGNIWKYFFYGSGLDVRDLRHDPFGLANYTGLAGTVVILLLLALSNDVSLRRLGRHRWKTLQRLNYAIFALVVAHGAVYQVLEKRRLVFVLVFAATVAAVSLVQTAGVRRVRAPDGGVTP
jgi:sulfoxide reductase heme-binding subunit YedZ